MEWYQPLSGFLVGTLVGMTGVGGGSLMTPLLIFLFGVAPATAVGTDLLFAAITKIGGIWAHTRRQTVQWRIVGLMMLGSVPTALITVQILRQLHAHGVKTDPLINVTLGIALVLTALVLLFKNSLHRTGRRLTVLAPQFKSLRAPATVFGGMILGVLVPISSIGAGALGAAMLIFLYPSQPTRNIVGTDLAHAVPLTLIAGVGHLFMGNVNTTLLLALLLGSLPGIYLGSHMSSKVPEKVLRTLLASMLMLIGVKFILTN
ncbi:MAG: sulfite exporter TauE/SafE family protein [Gammaproteobacteria bacterium]|nr:sulfite exporter TauE/SafE family protein [Gammaproteobacteria bacterium]